MTSPNTLFKGGKGETPPRGIIMDDRDVRTCLASGVLPPPSHFQDFAPELNPPEHGWGWIDPMVERPPIAVQKPRRACLICVPSAQSKSDYLNNSLPASLIESIAFQSEQAASDWIARSESFEGLPERLPTTHVLNELTFVETESPAESKATDFPQFPTERDRVAGVITMILATGLACPAVMKKLAEVELPDRSLVSDLVAESVSVEEGTLASCLEEFANDTWAGGFDPMDLLDALKSRLVDVMDADRVEKWSGYVGEVLQNKREASPDALSDDGDVILRSLQMVLRTAPLTVREMEKQIAARGESVGRFVGQLSLALAAWYEGFAALTGTVKERPEVYSIGSRTAVGSDFYPLKFSVTTRDGADLSWETVLLEGEREIASHVARPASQFLQAYYATETICAERGWQLAYDRDHERMQIEVGDHEIAARLHAGNQICWLVRLELRRKRARTWPKGFLEAVLETAADCHCNVSSSKGYPFLELRNYQLIGTMDREEVEFHIKNISDDATKITELSI